ncbi:hypothetical protein HK105_204415 [Polyrhizophydium stewartii]|uniref:Chitin-binding type-3 domain-containing protein n=1 Tax=Polyrhizophydium stewartii TaxID=2732419 RepID=A0ABR4N951_9FUNG
MFGGGYAAWAPGNQYAPGTMVNYNGQVWRCIQCMPGQAMQYWVVETSFGQQGMQPGYGQPMMGQPGYGQPMMGQQGMQPGYGQPMMGQPMMGQPMMGQPGISWVPCAGGQIPPNAIQCGREADGSPLFVARAPIDGGIHIGKAHHGWSHANIGFAGQERQIGQYEILVGNPASIRWARSHGHFNPQSVGGVPVEGGREAGGQPLFIARAEEWGGMHIGKVGMHLDGCLIPYGGEEVTRHHYEVMLMN